METTEVFDVIVVGAQFAGLAFAIRAAELGLKVLVMDCKQDITKGYATTGMTAKRFVNILRLKPEHLLPPPVQVKYHGLTSMAYSIQTSFVQHPALLDILHTP